MLLDCCKHGRPWKGCSWCGHDIRIACVKYQVTATALWERRKGFTPS